MQLIDQPIHDAFNFFKYNFIESFAQLYSFGHWHADGL
jgi:hypothetical protein